MTARLSVRDACALWSWPERDDRPHQALRIHDPGASDELLVSSEGGRSRGTMARSRKRPTSRRLEERKRVLLAERRQPVERRHDVATLGEGEVRLDLDTIALAQGSRIEAEEAQRPPSVVLSSSYSMIPRA